MVTRSQNQDFANRVVHFFTSADKNIKRTVSHFASEGRAPQVIRRIINRFLTHGTTQYKKLKGRPLIQSSTRNIRKVKSKFDKNPNTSVRLVAKQLNLPKSTVSHIKLKKLGMKARVRRAVPKQTQEQEARSKTSDRKSVV